MNAMVYVLLATCNGDRFLREQIESILAQSYRPLRVLARDDGSSDTTPLILREFARRYPDRFLVLPPSPPTGSAARNFLRLIEAAVATPDLEYLAFADQDDVWLPKKMELEMDAMHRLEASTPAGQPLLVFSDLKIVDRQLQRLHDSMWTRVRLNPENVNRLNRLIAQNVVTGNTAVVNRPMAVLASRMPPDAYMHDWWIALLASVFGSAATVGEPTVLYRQHGANVLGASHGPRPLGIPRWRVHGPRRKHWETGTHQAEAFLRVYAAEIPESKSRVLAGFLRCAEHSNRLSRVWSWWRGGFFLSSGLRHNLSMLWYLWDMKAAKKESI